MFHVKHFLFFSRSFLCLCMGSIIFIKLFENRYLGDAEWEVVVFADAGKLVLPVLVFRFQNVRNTKYSASSVLVPDGASA